MKYVFVVMAIIAMGSENCKKRTIDDTRLVCTDSCTFIQGHFITPTGEGVPGISYEFYSQTRGSIFAGPKTRKIAAGKSGNDGAYSFKFKMNKDEFGSPASANLMFKFDYDTAKFVVPPHWSGKKFTGFEERIENFSRRDTSHTANVIMVPKGIIKVRLKGFIANVKSDSFGVTSGCKCGMQNKYPPGIKEYPRGIASVWAKTNDETLLLTACGNDETFLKITRWKNGTEQPYVDTVIFTPLDEVKEVEFKY